MSSITCQLQFHPIHTQVLEGNKSLYNDLNAYGIAYTMHDPGSIPPPPPVHNTPRSHRTSLPHYHLGGQSFLGADTIMRLPLSPDKVDADGV